MAGIVKWPEETRQSVITDCVKNGLTQGAAVEKYGVPRATVNYWVSVATNNIPPSRQKKTDGRRAKKAGKAAKPKAEAVASSTRRTFTEEEEDRIVADFLGGMRHGKVREKYGLSPSTASRLKGVAETRAKKKARADKRAAKHAHAEPEIQAAKGLTNGHAAPNGHVGGHSQAPRGEPLTPSKEAELLYLRSENARLKALVRAYTAELD
jgi:transposase-like protein